jgi:DNA-binding transcriptional ArsR family regulator
MNSAVRKQVAVLKALASEPRLEIMLLLREHPQCVNALAARLGMTQPAVSQHLQILRETGLVRAERRGIWIHYAIHPATLEQHGKAMADIFGGWFELAKPADGRRGCPPGLLNECQHKGPGGKPRARGRS